MTITQIKERLEALESKLRLLEEKLESHGPNARWLEDVTGSFANCKAHEVAMKLGRQYRQRQRPRVRKGGNVRPRH